MKSRSPEFMSRCRVLNFPCIEGRNRRSKLDGKIANEQMGYSRILTFPPPPVEFTPATNDLGFPLIQMMNGKEPVVWEDNESPTTQRNSKETSTAAHTRSATSRMLSCLSQTLPVGKSISKNRIPRPKNAFILYRSHVSQLLKETMAFKVRESNISSLVSEMWKKESDVVHAYYAKQAALEWVKYMKRLQQDRSVQTDEGHEVKSPSSNDDLFDPAYGVTGQLEVPGYPFMEKMSPSMIYSFKDATFPVSYDMNQFDMNYNYSPTNLSTSAFSTNTYPYVVGTGLDTSIRWPGIISAPTAWPK
ncbi:hypothetical protein PORY_001688 [Pneumocystis oryctolagi]|uniref:Uncharacterized protein n=1 Tax=Pneumocystis oryctolagi TaxID=42067 RepID=A0ACB7CDH6_9ASCO|nr:hypothetical protein PORY_001688 [Pneumocystis oryctolagi]